MKIFESLPDTSQNLLDGIMTRLSSLHSLEIADLYVNLRFWRY